MSAGFIGHDPQRVEALHRRVRSVVDDLRRFASSDPVAADALADVHRARVRLETEWLPLLDRIHASTAMTVPFAGRAMRTMSTSSPPADDDAMRPPSSEEFAADLIAAADAPAPSGRSDQVVLSNGWSWSCGPVSATTGQPASGCEFMPPSSWDLLTPVLMVASMLPVSGELIDGYDCVVGDMPCEAMLIPFFSGRAGRAVDELVDVAGTASRTARSTDEILMPGGVPLGRAGSRPVIREVTGTVADAEAVFIELSRGGELILADADHLRVRLPDGGFVGLRTRMSDLSRTTNATVDVKIRGYEAIKRIKYNP